MSVKSENKITLRIESMSKMREFPVTRKFFLTILFCR